MSTYPSPERLAEIRAIKGHIVAEYQEKDRRITDYNLVPDLLVALNQRDAALEAARGALMRTTGSLGLMLNGAKPAIGHWSNYDVAKSVLTQLTALQTKDNP